MVSDAVYEVLLEGLSIFGDPKHFIVSVDGIADPSNIDDRVISLGTVRNRIIIDAFMANVNTGIEYCQEALESKDPEIRKRAVSTLYAMGCVTAQNPRGDIPSTDRYIRLLSQHNAAETDESVKAMIGCYLPVPALMG